MPAKRIKVETSCKPVIDWDDAMKILDREFVLGATDEQACKIAGISEKSLYDYCKENPEYSHRKEVLKKMPNYKARVNITKAIEKGDLKISQWYLEHKDDEFKNKSSVEVDNKQPILVFKEAQKEAVDKIGDM